jgi:hypothetical protein
VLTCPADTGSGSFTHKFFRVAHSREDLIGQRDAIAHWARLSCGWMGRSPDYKASLMNALGANSAFYEKFAANATNWYARSQNHVLFMNHAIVNPPVDRMKPPDQIKDVFISIQKETDAGIAAHPCVAQRQRLRRLRRHDCIGGTMHGRLRREWLDRKYLDRQGLDRQGLDRSQRYRREPCVARGASGSQPPKESPTLPL